MSATLLVEIGTEELPARFVPAGLAELEKRLVALLDDHRIAHGAARRLGTPRRSVVMIGDVAPAGTSESKRSIGPPASVAFDDDGNPTKAALGWAKKQGIEVGEIQRVETERGEYCAADVTTVGAETAALVEERLAEIILSLPFPKSMRFGAPEISFGRPIRWLLVRLGDRALDVTVGPIRSGETTQPHRFHTDPSPIPVPTPEAYLGAVAAGGVIIDPAQRRETIVREAHALAKSVGGALVEDEALADEVTFLVEAPYPLIGSFDEGFLEVPREVLLSAMRAHQRYFSVEGADGKLLAHFITVAGTDTRDPDVVRAGNERVLRARLADARYFYDVDRKRPLAEHVGELEAVVYHAKLGSSLAKSERTKALAADLVGMLGHGDRATVERAAHLMKADLVTEMVGEFPDLQGVMGYHYALADGEREAVAVGIQEHYLPRFAGDDLPATDEGAILALADRVETIVGSFAAGDVPTGAADPFGLRRRAIGVIAITLGRDWAFDLGALVDAAIGRLPDALATDRDTVRAEIMDFFGGRLVQQLRGEGIAPDAVEAALASPALSELRSAVLRARALSQWKTRDDAETLYQGLRRVANILKKQAAGELDAALLTEPAERALFDALAEVEAAVREAASGSRYDEAIDLLAGLTVPIDRFFDDILVMADDPALRGARLGLLARVQAAFSLVGDLTRIQIAGS